jgi:predicted Zn-dependent protease
MIRSWRDQRRKTDIFSIAAMAAGLGGAGAGVWLGDYVQLAQLGTILSLFSYSREMEAEADAIGIKNMAAVGYDPMEMSNIWQQLIGEEASSARYRNKRRHRGGIFDTHPSSDARMADMRTDALELRSSGKTYGNGRERYLATIGPMRPMLLDDQVKLNDPGASQYLIETLAQDGWNGLLRYYEGEVWRLRNRPGDAARAEQSYAAAVAYSDAPADAWRWHGISLMKQGRAPDARAAFARYLKMKPDAPDAAWVRQMIG